VRAWPRHRSILPTFKPRLCGRASPQPLHRRYQLHPCLRCAHFRALRCPQTEDRDSEDGAGESCGGKCADGKHALQLSFQPPEGTQHDIEAGNPLSVEGVNPMVSDSSVPVGNAAEQPASRMAGRLARFKQMLWRNSGPAALAAESTAS